MRAVRREVSHPRYQRGAVTAELRRETLFLFINVETDLFIFGIGDADVALGRGDNDVFTGRRRAKLLREIDLNREHVPFDFHVNVLHMLLLVSGDDAVVNS
jgi:hypothetical protein